MRRLFTLGALALGAGLAALAASAPRPVEAKAERQVSAEEVLDLVYLDEKRPVLLRLHLFIDGKPYRTAFAADWDAYVRKLFTHLDRNGDGYLNEEEVRHAPPPSFNSNGRDGSNNAINVAFNYRVVDDDSDGKVTPQELTRYYQQYGGGTFQVQVAPRGTPSTAKLQEELFALFDQDKDGKLSKAELDAAERTLFQRDADNDELLTLPELVPQMYGGRTAVQPQIVSAAAARLAPPFLALTSTEASAQLIERLLRMYGGAETGGEKKLTRNDLALDKDAFERLDANKDGTLDVAELQRFAERPADMEWTVRLGKTEGQAPFELFASAGKAAPLASSVRRSTAGAFVLTLEKARIELRRNEGRPNLPPHAIDVLLSQYQAADTDGDGKVSQKETQVNNFYPTLFSLLDRDGDGFIQRAEAEDYFKQVQEAQARAVTNLPTLLISAEGTTLFDLLDRNCDGRLSRREVRDAAAVLLPLDRNGDGQVAAEELVKSFQLALGLYQAGFGRTGGSGVFTPPGLPLLTLDWGNAGLIWFHKMDRNRDGDVSLKEFLGPQETFRKLDLDGDGLVSVEEAQKADAQYRR